jgi:hypothetical protein
VLWLLGARVFELEVEPLRREKIDDPDLELRRDLFLSRPLTVLDRRRTERTRTGEFQSATVVGAYTRTLQSGLIV